MDSVVPLFPLLLLLLLMLVLLLLLLWSIPILELWEIRLNSTLWSLSLSPGQNEWKGLEEKNSASNLVDEGNLFNFSVKQEMKK